VNIIKRLGRNIWYYLEGLYYRVDQHHIFLTASGLAFSLFICIVPLILIVFFVLGYILQKPSVAEEIDLFIDKAIPYAEYAAYIKSKVFPRLHEFTLYKGLAGPIGFVGLFLASTGLFSSMRTTLNTVYKIQPTESLLLGKLRDLAMVLFVLLYFLLSVAILPVLEVVKEYAGGLTVLDSLKIGFVENFIYGGLSFVVMLVIFFLLYWFIPQRSMPIKPVLVSAVSSALLWELARQLFGVYINHVVTFNRIYGAYALVVVVAFWIYFTSIVFIIGAEIGQLYREKNKNVSIKN
jgi:membrane protein